MRTRDTAFRVYYTAGLLETFSMNEDSVARLRTALCVLFLISVPSLMAGGQVRPSQPGAIPGKNDRGGLQEHPGTQGPSRDQLIPAMQFITSSLAGGLIPNVAYSLYLLSRNQSWAVFRSTTVPDGLRAALMGDSGWELLPCMEWERSISVLAELPSAGAYCKFS